MPEAPRRVVLSGYYGYGNLGDDAIYQVLTGALVAAGCAEIVVPAGDAALLPPCPVVTPVGRFAWHRIATALRAGAVLISGGGGLLQDETSFRSLAYYLALMRLARACRRPYAVAFCSLGPLRRRLSRGMVASALRRASAVVVRDSGSERLAAELGTPAERLTRAPDLAFALEPPAAEPRGSIALCLRPTRHTERVCAAVGDWLDHLPPETPVRFVPFAGEDETLGRRLAVERPLLHTVRRPNSVHELMGELAAARLVIAERFHAAVLAVRLGVPCAVIEYDPKVTGLAADLGLACAGPDAALTAERLSHAVAAAAGVSVDPRPLSERVETALRTLFAALAEP